jgi:hypothetical protein
MWKIFLRYPFQTILLTRVVIVLVVAGSQGHFDQQEQKIPIQEFQPHQVQISSIKLPTLDDLSIQWWEQLGHGIALDTQLVLTNQHVVADDSLLYALNSSVPELEIINIWYYDREDWLDLALVRTKWEIETSISTPIADQQLDSQQAFRYLQGSQRILCRSQESLGDYLLASNCRFTPWQSGTPVFNLDNELVGIVTATNNQKWVITLVTQNLLTTWMTRLGLES